MSYIKDGQVHLDEDCLKCNYEMFYMCFVAPLEEKFGIKGNVPDIFSNRLDLIKYLLRLDPDNHKSDIEDNN